MGDDTAGVAAVIDPRRDVDVYLDVARDRDLRISHVIDLGAIRLHVITTPGHTPEHVCLALSDEAQGTGPFALSRAQTATRIAVHTPALLRISSGST